MDFHTAAVIAVFIAVYLGIALGRWPMLKIDRTGIALCGATVLLLLGPPGGDLARHVDVGTLAMLFGLMVLSAQFDAAGFHAWNARRRPTGSPRRI
ncbi:MAG: hypothetical protein RIB59_04895 [Rhodospirillales bacterium]